MDFYAVLKLNRAATLDDIKNAYRSAAPELCRRRGDSLASADRFAQLCRAYAALSHAGTSQEAPELVGTCTDPLTVFRDFFGTDDPLEAAHGTPVSFNPRVERAIEECTGPKQQPRGQPELRWLDCTLEEVHAGCVRSEPRLARARDDPGPVPLDLVMRVPPGAAAGLRFAFPGQAEPEAGSRPGDIIFELRVLEHPRFERRGQDLHCRAAVPLHQALTGAAVVVDALDGRRLRIPAPGVLAAGAELRAAGEGLCGKGDLVVHIDVHWPEQLSNSQRMLLRAALFLPAAPSQEQAAAVAAFDAAFRDGRHGWASRQQRQP